PEPIRTIISWGQERTELRPRQAPRWGIGRRGADARGPSCPARPLLVLPSRSAGSRCCVPHLRHGGRGRGLVSSSQSSRTIWQDFEVAAAVRAKGKRQKPKGKGQKSGSGTFALCLLVFAFCLDSSPTLVFAGSPPSMVPAPPGWGATFQSPRASTRP